MTRKKLGDIVDMFCFQENNLDWIIPLYIGTQIMFIMTYAAFALLLIIKCQFIANLTISKSENLQFPQSKDLQRVRWKKAFNKKNLPEKQTKKNKINIWLVQVCNSVTTLLSNIACGTKNTIFLRVKKNFLISLKVS